MYSCRNLFPGEGFTSPWWPVLSESCKCGSTLQGFVAGGVPGRVPGRALPIDSKATGGEHKIVTLTASVLPPAFVLLPHTTQGFLYISILLVSLNTQQIKHWLSLNCGKHISASVFRGHGWKPWRSWRVSATPLPSNRCEVHRCWKCILAVPGHLMRPGLSHTFFPGVLGTEPSLAGKRVPAPSGYCWFGH